MLPQISAVQHTGDYKLELTFTDGAKVEFDFRDKIVGRGGVFRMLEDPDYFRRVEVDDEIGTIVWPNGVDFCPDVLYSEATGEPLPVSEKASSA